MRSNNNHSLNLANITKRIKSLPLLPSVICELMQLNPDSDDFFEKIAEIAQFEPALTTRVLSIVNSISAAPVDPVVDIHQALIRAGSDEVLSCITLLSVAQVFTPVSDEQKNLWQHSIETALFSQYLALQNKVVELDSSMAYSCGLLHDLGRFVLFNLSSHSIDFIGVKDWQTPEELPEVELKYLGFTHVQVGEMAAKRWQLPKVIGQVIKYHHDYDHIGQLELSKALKQLIYTIQLADYLSMYCLYNPHWKTLDESELTEAIELNCIAKVSDALELDVPSLVAAIPSIIKQGQQGMQKLKIA